MFFAFAAILFAVKAQADCKLPPAQNECGAVLGTLCRSGHSMRRLADGKILFVGGKYKNGTACDVVAFDPVKVSIEGRGYLPYEGFETTLGMRVNDNLIGFTNRMPGLDPNNEHDQQDDFMAFYDTNAVKWADALLVMSRKSQASSPAVIRYPDKTELVLFQGMYTREQCSGQNDSELGCDYTVTIFSRFSEMSMHIEKDKFIEIKAQDVTVSSESGESLKFENGKFVKDRYYLPVTERKKITVKNISPKTEVSHAGNEFGIPLRRARIQFDSTTFPDGRIFIVGGQELLTGEQRTNRFDLSIATTAEFYIPSEKAWFETPPLPVPISTARSFTLSEQEVLVVDTVMGRSFIWSFALKSWREGFKIDRNIYRGMMHSSGRFIAIVPGIKGAELFVWTPASKVSEFIKSPLNVMDGIALVELQNQTILEAQTGGLLIWDIKKKAVTRLRK